MSCKLLEDPLMGRSRGILSPAIIDINLPLLESGPRLSRTSIESAMSARSHSP